MAATVRADHGPTNASSCEARPSLKTTNCQELPAVGKMIEDDGGKHAIKTVSGGTLVAMMKDDKIVLHDENEGTATVTIADVKQSNGVIHIIDRVLLPK